MALAVFIEWPLNVDLGIVATGARAGVAKNEEVQAVAAGMGGKDSVPRQREPGTKGAVVRGAERGRAGVGRRLRIGRCLWIGRCL